MSDTRPEELNYGESDCEEIDYEDVARRALLRAGTVAHYLDAAYYDQAYRRRKVDRDYYGGLAKGEMLELGAGTGRVTLAIAETLSKVGGHVLGVDSMEPMLERARARFAKRPKRVQACASFEQADFRTLELGKKFDQIVAPFNALMHLYALDEIAETFESVRNHLKGDGVFRFDVLLPSPEVLSRDPEQVFRAGTVVLPENKKRYRYSERYDYDPATQVQMMELIFESVDDPADRVVVPLAHRQFFPQELRMLLDVAGFDVVSIEGDFDGARLTGDAESQVVTCVLQ